MDHIFKNCSLVLFISSSIYWFYYMRILEYLKIIAGSSNSFAHLNCVHPSLPWFSFRWLWHCLPDLAKYSICLSVCLAQLCSFLLRSSLLSGSHIEAKVSLIPAKPCLWLIFPFQMLKRSQWVLYSFIKPKTALTPLPLITCETF